MSTLAQDFNVGAVQSGHYQRMDVTLTWDSDVPMEFRLHMWQPTKDGEGVTVIWSVSRDLLDVACIGDHGEYFGTGDITAARVRLPGHGETTPACVDAVYLRLSSEDGAIRLSFPTNPLAAFVRSSLAMCPTESEALDVDGLITQIFHAEEAQ